MNNLFCFGLGFSALALARRLLGEGWTVAGTCRTAEKCAAMKAQGIDAYVFDGAIPLDSAGETALRAADHLLISIPPDQDGDPALKRTGPALRDMAEQLRWVGYLSTTGVYGDTGGATVTEDSPLAPTSNRSRQRAEAEADWLTLYEQSGMPVHIFRLAGIYGPGRSVLDQLQRGNARCVDKPGHKFSRIHVEDIANALRASIDHLAPGAVYNVCDDEPAPQAEVVAHGAKLLGMPAPTPVPFAQAAETMSPMARSFWRDNRIVSNARLKRDLDLSLDYPTYREGLAAILADLG